MAGITKDAAQNRSQHLTNAALAYRPRSTRLAYGHADVRTPEPARPRTHSRGWCGLRRSPETVSCVAADLIRRRRQATQDPSAAL